MADPEFAGSAGQRSGFGNRQNGFEVIPVNAIRAAARFRRGSLLSRISVFVYDYANSISIYLELYCVFGQFSLCDRSTTEEIDIMSQQTCSQLQVFNAYRGAFRVGPGVGHPHGLPADYVWSNGRIRTERVAQQAGAARKRVIGELLRCLFRPRA